MYIQKKEMMLLLLKRKQLNRRAREYLTWFVTQKGDDNPGQRNKKKPIPDTDTGFPGLISVKDEDKR